MAVGYRSSTSTGVSDSLVSSVNVPVPSAAATNDIALVALELWNAGDPTVTPPSGFTLLSSTVSGDQKLKVFWKRLTGADAGNYTFSWTGAQWTVGHCVLFTGVKTTGDPIGSNFNTATAASGTAIPSTSVTVGFSPGLAHFCANENSATHTPPTSFTEVQESNYLVSNYRIPGGTGTFTAPSGVLSASTLSLALLAALETAGGSQSAAANTAAESDAAQSLGKRKTKAVGLPVETETAPTIARSKRRGLPVAAETDAALPFTRRKAKSVSQALSTEQALPIAARRLRPLGTATGTETALPIGKVKRKALPLVAETDAALAIASTSGTSQAIGTATSVEVALPIGHRRSRLVGTAMELDVALPATFVNPAWRLINPSRVEEYPLRGSLMTTLRREVTVFGDEDGLFTAERGAPSAGTDEYGAIPFGTKYIWLGGHVNVTSDPAVKNLWLSAGFEVENVQLG